MHLNWYKNIVGLVFLLLAISCSEKKIELSTDEKAEIENLQSDEERNQYLFDLWHQDQYFRNGEEGDIISKHGYKSAEHEKWRDQFVANDNEVFQKIAYYLEKQGYPTNPSAYDELALNAFPIIIGHNHRYDSQKRLLSYLFDAYKQGHCPLDDVVWVLGEMHESKYQGKRYEMKAQRYTTEDEFTELVKKLNLNLEL